MVVFSIALWKQKRFFWDIKGERPVMPQYIKDDDTVYLYVDIDQLSNTDLVVFDSWTRIVHDMVLQYSLEHNVDLFSGELGVKNSSGKEDSMHYFRYQTRVLSAAMHSITSIGSHVAVTAHETFYEHKVKKGVATEKITKLQVASSSGKQAATMAGYFSDVLYFSKRTFPNAGIDISTNGNDYRTGGCRTMGASKNDFDNWSFIDYATAAGLNIPDPATLPPTSASFSAFTGRDYHAQKAANQQATQPAQPAGLIKV